jgi:dTDP-4-dehydrorhamnose reductase
MACHMPNIGACSWHDFASEALRLAGAQTPIIAMTSAEYPQKAKRPACSELDHYRFRLLGLDDTCTWQDALAEYMRAKGHLRKGPPGW